MKKLIVIGWALALVMAACAGDRESITEEFLPDTPTTTTDGSVTPTSATTPTTTPARVSIEALIETVRDTRQVDFPTPTIAYLPQEEVQAGYLDLHGIPRTGNAPFDDAYYRMLGVLPDGDSLGELDDPCPVPAFYDPTSGTLIVADGLDDFTPLDRTQLVTELTAAATDAAHDWSDVLVERLAADDHDGVAALWGLVRGDAVFHAQRYADEILSSTDRFAITLEQISCGQGRPEAPPFVSEMEAFGPEVGVGLVEELIAFGGIEALNEAYGRPPSTTEHVYHPARYAARESAAADEVDPISLTGFEEIDTGNLGERYFRAVLSGGVGTAQALQAATGWGGDAYRVLWNGSDVVLVARFVGDEARDARELAETLGGWASAALGVGAGRPDNTGLAFEGEDYAFVAHDGDDMLLVVSSDAVAGRKARDTFWPEW